MPDNEEDKRPLGQKIRDFINPALADQRKNALQLDMLDKIFTQMADLMPKIFDKEFKSIFNHVSSRTKDKPELVAPIIINAITAAAQNEDADSPYSPTRRFQIPISTAFTSFTPEEIKNLPGYQKLHEAARDMDVALKVSGLTGEEAERGGTPILSVNAMKTYEEGAFENYEMYPVLPPKKVDFDKGSSKDFNL